MILFRGIKIACLLSDVETIGLLATLRPTRFLFKRQNYFLELCYDVLIAGVVTRLEIFHLSARNFSLTLFINPITGNCKLLVILQFNSQFVNKFFPSRCNLHWLNEKQLESVVFNMIIKDIGSYYIYYLLFVGRCCCFWVLYIVGKYERKEN